MTGGGRGLGRAVALAECGGLHLLINHACRGMRFVSETFMEVPTTFWGVAARTWRLVVDTNVTGPGLMPTRWHCTCVANNRPRTLHLAVWRGVRRIGPSRTMLPLDTRVCETV